MRWRIAYNFILCSGRSLFVLGGLNLLEEVRPSNGGDILHEVEDGDDGDGVDWGHGRLVVLVNHVVVDVQDLSGGGLRDQTDGLEHLDGGHELSLVQLAVHVGVSGLIDLLNPLSHLLNGLNVVVDVLGFITSHNAIGVLIVPNELSFDISITHANEIDDPCNSGAPAGLVDRTLISAHVSIVHLRPEHLERSWLVEVRRDGRFDQLSGLSSTEVIRIEHEISAGLILVDLAIAIQVETIEDSL